MKSWLWWSRISPHVYCLTSLAPVLMWSASLYIPYHTNTCRIKAKVHRLFVARYYSLTSTTKGLLYAGVATCCEAKKCSMLQWRGTHCAPSRRMYVSLLSFAYFPLTYNKIHPRWKHRFAHCIQTAWKSSPKNNSLKMPVSYLKSLCFKTD